MNSTIITLDTVCKTNILKHSEDQYSRVSRSLFSTFQTKSYPFTFSTAEMDKKKKRTNLKLSQQGNISLEQYMKLKNSWYRLTVQ